MHKLIINLCLIGILALTACSSPETPQLNAGQSKIDETANLVYITTHNETPDIRVSSSIFEVPTNNCGSPVSTFETLSEARQFAISAEFNLSQALAAEISGDVAVAEAKLASEVERSFGIKVGAVKIVESERTIETPSNSISVVKLRWDEVWSKGNISITHSDGAEIGSVPFYILTTLRLTQLEVDTTRCDKSQEPEPEVQPEKELTNPADIIAGVWSGQARNGDFEFDISVTLTKPCKIGSVCGSFNIPAIPCAGTFKLLNVQDKRFQFEAGDLQGTCEAGAEDYLELLSDDTLSYFSRGSYGESQGILRKAGN